MELSHISRHNTSAQFWEKLDPKLIQNFTLCETVPVDLKKKHLKIDYFCFLLQILFVLRKTIIFDIKLNKNYFFSLSTFHCFDILYPGLDH